MFDYFKNIRTFPANTRVYRNGVFAPDLSDESMGADFPLHIIHIGKIEGVHNWFIDVFDPRDVFLTARIEADGDAKINLEINLNLENIGFDGKIFIKNAGDLTLNVIGNNNKSGTKIKCHAKLFAAAASRNNLSGLANIPSEIANAETDIAFSALCERGVKLLKMSPAQRISSVPENAGHSASIYRPAPAQIQYLETAGLSARESAELLDRVFMEEEI
jgi:hypothetical protein